MENGGKRGRWREEGREEDGERREDRKMERGGKRGRKRKVGRVGPEEKGC